MAEISNNLPPGWDCKYDPRTSRYYFINHYTKQTTWEDPRLRFRQIHGTPTHVEHIPLQHGSPEFRRNYVYPSQTCPQPAFQMPKTVPVQDLSNLRGMSRTSNGAGPAPGTPKSKDTTLSQVPTDTEQAVGKISTMFPTVPETHIRLLMKKYYNREAVVISALQVEKYPITTPGPFTTPPPSRNLQNSANPTPPAMRAIVAAAVSRATGCNSATNSPKPHSSPKMKLRYMKSIFPLVEETILLEALGNNENNVQKASEALIGMGFERKDPKLAKQKSGSTKRESALKKAEETARAAAAVPKILTPEEKDKLKKKLHEKYRTIPERVIVLALESAEYHSNRAQQILDVVVQEETAIAAKNSAVASTSTAKESENQELKKDKIGDSSGDILKKSKSSLITPSPSIHAFQSDKLDTKVRRTKEKKNSVRETLQENVAPDSGTYRSSYLLHSQGPDSRLVKGSDNGMLLEDYVSWDGPDPRLRSGSAGLAQGPNRSLLMGRSLAQGPNASLRKGPTCGLAKGSLYTQMQAITITESRGK